MKHNQQMIDAFVRIRATGASHVQIAQHLGISKNTSCEWSHLHAEAIEETIKENREDARFYENFQRAEELVNVNKIIKNFLFRIENDRYGFGHTMNYKDTCRMLGVMVKHREYLFKRNGDNPIAVRAIPGHPAKRPSPAAAAAQEPQPAQPQTASPTGPTGMRIPVPENEPTPQNPNKTNSSIEKQPETIPQKNAHPIPVPNPMERRFATGEALPHQSRISTIQRALPHICPFARYNLALPYPPPVPDPLGARQSRPQHPTLSEAVENNRTLETECARSVTPTLTPLQIREHRIDLLNRIEREVAGIRSRFPQFAGKSNTKNTPFPAWTASDRRTTNEQI